MKVSVICITLVRDMLYILLEELASQSLSESFEIVLIPQPPGKLDPSRIPTDLSVQIHEEPYGMGFGHYRQLGLEKADGEVLVWIDDDELPSDKLWLNKITRPIIEGNEKVVTGGYHIPLGQGYIADGISWLGLPGGGYPGFRLMWDVDQDGYTDHLCTGNLAFDKATICAIGGFDTSRKSGNEDVELGDRLKDNNIKIKFLDDVFVIHEARKELKTFIKWHVERGRAHREFIKDRSSGSGGKIISRLWSSIKIMKMTLKTRYFPIVCLLTVMQYGAQLAGSLGLVSYSRYD